MADKESHVLKKLQIENKDVYVEVANRDASGNIISETYATKKEVPSTEEIEQAVANAEASAQAAGQSATNAGNEAAEATRQAGIATNINAQTVAMINSKFWFGTVEEYNALETITADTFYFIRDDS